MARLGSLGQVEAETGAGTRAIIKKIELELDRMDRILATINRNNVFISPLVTATAGVNGTPDYLPKFKIGLGGNIELVNSIASQDAASTYITVAGQVAVGGSTPTSQIHTRSGAAARICEIVQAAASQTAHLSSWRNSAGNTNSFITSAGYLGILNPASASPSQFEEAMISLDANGAVSGASASISMRNRSGHQWGFNVVNTLDVFSIVRTGVLDLLQVSAVPPASGANSPRTTVWMSQARAADPAVGIRRFSIGATADLLQFYDESPALILARVDYRGRLGIGVAPADAIAQFKTALSPDVPALKLDTTTGQGADIQQWAVAGNVQLTITSDGGLRFWDTDRSHYTYFIAGNQAANALYTLPVARPSASLQVLTATNAEPSIMSWASASTLSLVSGSGTTGTLPKWTDGPGGVLGNSLLTESGTTITSAASIVPSGARDLGTGTLEWGAVYTPAVITTGSALNIKTGSGVPGASTPRLSIGGGAGLQTAVWTSMSSMDMGGASIATVGGAITTTTGSISATSGNISTNTGGLGGAFIDVGTMGGTKKVSFWDIDSSFFSSFKAGDQAADLEYTWPISRAANRLLKTDGSGILSWAQADLTTDITGDLPYANFTQGSARSVLGVTGNATADHASIQGTANQALVVNSAGTALAFGQVNLAAAAAVTGTLPATLGGTDQASYVAWDILYANTTTSLVRLPGSTIVTPTFLSSTGDGVDSIGIAWSTLGVGDIPSLSTSKITSGIFAAVRGGTNNAFFQVSGPATSTKTYTFANSSVTIADTSTTQTLTSKTLSSPTLSGTITLADSANMALNTGTGTQIATAITQKLGFYAATPIAQRAGAAQASVATTASTSTLPFGYTTAAQADAIVTLVNELRAWAVAQGFIKGAA